MYRSVSTGGGLGCVAHHWFLVWPTMMLLWHQMLAHYDAAVASDVSQWPVIGQCTVIFISH